MKDTIGQELKVGDKILLFGILKTRIRSFKGIISRFTEKSLFYYLKNDKKFWLENPKLYERRITHTGSVLKYDWSKNNG